MALTGSYDLGDKVYLTWNTVDSSGAAVNPGTVTLNITLPDATNVSVTTATSITGTYTASYLPTQVGRHIIAWSAGTTWSQAYSDIFEVRDINDIGIVGYDEVLEFLNIPTASANENEVRRFIDASTDLAETYVGQVLGRRTFTNELYDGGTEFIRIRNPKAISITSVTENGLAVSASNYVLDYTGQRLYRIVSSSLFYGTASGIWRPGVQNIVITYRAGYVNPPPTARQGVLELIKHLWQTQRGSMNVLNLDADSYQPAIGYSMPRRVEQLLDINGLAGMA